MLPQIPELPHLSFPRDFNLPTLPGEAQRVCSGAGKSKELTTAEAGGFSPRSRFLHLTGSDSVCDCVNSPQFPPGMRCLGSGRQQLLVAVESLAFSSRNHQQGVCGCNKLSARGLRQSLISCKPWPGPREAPSVPWPRTAWSRSPRSERLSAIPLSRLIFFPSTSSHRGKKPPKTPKLCSARH